MQRVSEVMSRDAQVVFPQESLQRAAQLMDELNVGSLPVCDGQRLVGMVTDRDITVRGTAAGKMPGEAHVDEVMTAEVRWCFEDQPLDEVMIQMADSQIRRIPVVSHDDQKRLVGIVSLGDVATKTRDPAQKPDVKDVVEMVSEPGPASGPAMQADKIAGRRGEVPADAGAGRPAGTSGTNMPGAGQSSMGVAGSSGEPEPAADQSGD